MAFDQEHRVYQELRRRIVGGQLKPGDALRAQYLAEQLNVSIVPIREALIRLSERGIVDSRSHAGFYVCNYGPSKIVHLIRSMNALYSLWVPNIPRSQLSCCNVEEYEKQCRALNPDGFQLYMLDCVGAFNRIFLPPMPAYVLTKLYDMTFQARLGVDQCDIDQSMLRIEQGIRCLHERDLI